MNTYEAMLRSLEARYSDINNASRAELYGLASAYWRDEMDRSNRFEPLTESRYAGFIVDDLIDLMDLASQPQSVTVDTRMAELKNRILSGLMAGCREYIIGCIDTDKRRETEMNNTPYTIEHPGVIRIVTADGCLVVIGPDGIEAYRSEQEEADGKLPIMSEPLPWGDSHD